jgi:hypothetical protein
MVSFEDRWGQGAPLLRTRVVAVDREGTVGRDASEVATEIPLVTRGEEIVFVDLLSQLRRGKRKGLVSESS